MSDVTTYPVVFRTEGKGDDRSVIAFLPYTPANVGNLACYAHIGQHSQAAWAYYRRTRRATESQYRDLLAELRCRYETGGDDAVRLVVRQRLPRDWRDHAWGRR